MTGRATDVTHVQVTRVIELHTETSEPWKWLERARLHGCVTDGANRTFSAGKLLRMTSGAGQVLRRSRTTRYRGVRIATMAEQTRKSRMIFGAVLEFGIIEPLGKLHLLLRRLHRFRRRH